MARYREDHSKNSFSKHTDTPGLGHTSHFREGPTMIDWMGGVWKLGKCELPLNLEPVGNGEYVCIPDEVEPVTRVDDGGVSAILLAVGLLSIAFIRRFS